MPALFVGIGVNTLALGWAGAKEVAAGGWAGPGAVAALRFDKKPGWRRLEAGGALGAFLGPSRLITVLLVTVLVAGLMAVVVIIWKKRVGQTLRNLAHMLAALFTLHLPGPEVSLDNPESLKIPFGVAVAVTVVLYTVRQAWGF